MEPHQKAEIISACRQYADAKFRLRRLFPSLKTFSEIDDIATLVIDVASSALSVALTGESKKIKKSLLLADKALVHGRKTDEPIMKAMKWEGAEPFLVQDRIKAVIMGRGNSRMSARQVTEAIKAQGWPVSTVKNIGNFLGRYKNTFRSHGQGRSTLYTVRLRAPNKAKPGEAQAAAKKPQKAKRKPGPHTKKGSVAPPMVWGIIEKHFKEGDFSAVAVAKKLGVHPWSIRATFRRLHQEGFIEPNGKRGTPGRTWKLTAKAVKLNGHSLVEVNKVFPDVADPLV